MDYLVSAVDNLTEGTPRTGRDIELVPLTSAMPDGDYGATRPRTRM
ncbi:hypothetical protein PS467_41635 [Streptomyces luomodiensis]|uniref:Uncharacterized protein n=1 Tax=Streptomyces luomodiensis TaxID=3026192 RepID=A0ABY9VBT9_9ACTN|nr:hypothetical protein [Streptomyces sp. SCA4-21]WNF01370.1 hypothetical protein PS467_41635 [Streptomyces sp. SCA4-21]